MDTKENGGEVLACPFCGSAAHVEYDTMGLATNGRVHCVAVDCRADVWSEKGKDAAIAMWNRRAARPASANAVGQGFITGTGQPVIGATWGKDADGGLVLIGSANRQDLPKPDCYYVTDGDLDREYNTIEEFSGGRRKGNPLFTADQMQAHAAEIERGFQAHIAKMETASQDVAAWVNGDDLDNMLDDRTAAIQGQRSGLRATPLYTRPAAADAGNQATEEGAQRARFEHWCWNDGPYSPNIKTERMPHGGYASLQADGAWQAWLHLNSLAGFAAGNQGHSRADLEAARNAAYPAPDSPHGSVNMRAVADRMAFTRGWDAARGGAVGAGNQDERATFELEVAKLAKSVDVSRYSEEKAAHNNHAFPAPQFSPVMAGDYIMSSVQAAWMMWQARAALAKQPDVGAADLLTTRTLTDTHGRDWTLIEPAQKGGA